MNIIRNAFFIFILTVLSAAVQAQEIKPYSSKIDSLLQSLDKSNKAWASVTIRQNNQIVYSRATGLIDKNAPIPFKSNPDTRYRIGSISKMFTSVMIMQLIEEIKLSLDTPLSKFFNKIPNSNSITIADLLNHHSGLYNFTNNEDYIKWMTEPRTRTQMRELFESQKPAFAPREKGEYSNTNFVLLGYIIEDVTGKSYDENLSERITSRIALRNTKHGSKIGNGEAESFRYVGGEWVKQPQTDMSIPGGAGAIISTTPDLTAFITSLFEGKFISESSLKNMTTINDGYGLGIFKIPFYERSAFGHTGGIDGFSSSLVYFPEDKVSIAFCSNGLNYPMNNIMIGLLSYYYDKPYVIPDFKTISLPSQKLAAYEGEYTSEQLPLVITVKHDGDQLTAQATGQPPFPLDAMSETEFRFDQAGIVMIFSILNNGIIDGFTLKQGADYVYKKIVKP
jgi:CubicO group peptidase (beta-lactamase class C family)